MNRPKPKDRTYYLKMARYDAEGHIQDSVYYRLGFYSFVPFARSDRIWQGLDDGSVSLVKDRYHELANPVDLKEFFWVKLSAVDYDGSF